MTAFSEGFALRTEAMNPSPIREILKVVAQPDIISFAGGMPPSELFPTAEIEAATHRVLADRRLTIAALQYGPSEGYGPLRTFLAESLNAEGIRCTEQNIILTTGSQQGIDLVSRLFLDPGDVVAVEDPTFLGALQSFNGCQARYLAVPMDEHGMRVEQLAEALGGPRRPLPKLIYVIPNFQNPTGLCWSDERRKELLALAAEYRIPVLEDDPYVEIYFGGERPRSLLRDVERDNVILARTFSKSVAPGLRLGYMVVPSAYMGRLLPLKQCSDLHSSGLAQLVVNEFLRSGPLVEGHLRQVRQVYRQRRDRMLTAIAEHFPVDATYTRPEGGMFTWVTLPEPIRTERLFHEAIAQKVAFIPGAPFFANGGGPCTLRLNFSNAPEERISEGIQRLGEVIRDHVRRGPTAPSPAELPL